MLANAAIALRSYIPAIPDSIPAVPETAPASQKDAFRTLRERGLLDALLLDRTTKGRVIWATDTYAGLGNGFGKRDGISPDLIAGRHDELAAIRKKKRAERVRKHGEVTTPLWVCKKMCDHANKVLRGKDWKKYVDATVLEITCGEAPFLTSRHDFATGAFVPLPDRVGLLDRKIRLVTEKAKDRSEWLEWVFRAYQATYGYEFQGDNLLLARINLLKTFEENLRDRWTQEPTQNEYKRIVDIIVWNIWQMDGLTGTIPYGKVGKAEYLDLFGKNGKHGNMTPPCLIRDWQAGENVEYLSLGK